MLSDAHSGTTVVCAWAVQVQSAGRPPVAAADDLNETLTVSPRFPNTFQAAGWGRDAYRRKVSRLLLTGGRRPGQLPAAWLVAGVGGGAPWPCARRPACPASTGRPAFRRVPGIRSSGAC